MEGVNYTDPWKKILIKRGLATIMYLVLAFAVAGLIVLIGGIQNKPIKKEICSLHNGLGHRRCPGSSGGVCVP